MKKIPVFIVLPILLLAANLSYSQQPGEKKGWPSYERYAFITSCIREARANMSEDSARFYCYCMQEKVELKYPNIELAAKITEAEMESAVWQTDIKSCLGGFWGTEEREAFLSNCIETAEKGGSGTEKAKNYCNCMLFKIETRYPNPLNATDLTPEKLSSPEWKKIIQGCMDF
ncbi:MAG: hypothetical protein ABL876_12990 [Chitinophagaceae bacterium]